MRQVYTQMKRWGPLGVSAAPAACLFARAMRRAMPRAWLGFGEAAAPAEALAARGRITADRGMANFERRFRAGGPAGDADEFIL